MSSFSENLGDVADFHTDDSPNVPWEVVRWTKLRKIQGQVFSEMGKRKFGIPTVLAVLLVSDLAYLGFWSYCDWDFERTCSNC
jgi:hypothetical protein